MELTAAISARKMTRAFDKRPLDPSALDTLLDLSRRAPSAGNSQAVGFTVLEGCEQTERYWGITLAGEKRQRFRWQQLLDAPVLVLVTTEPARYLARYSEGDKAATGRGTSAARWPVPYWWVDAGAVIENLLLLVADRGLGACLFGPFDFETAIRHELGIGAERRIVATIAVGHPLPDEPGRSQRRGWRDLASVIERPLPHRAE